MRVHPAGGDRAHARDGERGYALILGLMFAVVVVGLTVAGSSALKAHRSKTKTNFVTHGQASMFARSGLIEALGWLRKQSAQPVTSFLPQLDTGAEPPILDTIDPDIGIVREFQISGPVWGRYEVWKDWPADPDPVRLAWREQFRCLDVAAARGESAGLVWKLVCIGYVYRRVDPAVAFAVDPNQVLGRETLEVEVRRIALSPPGQAALCVDTGGTCAVGTKGRVIGGSLGAGIYYPTGTGTPTLAGSGSSITGTPPLSAATAYDGSLEAIFGVDLDELRTVANHVVTHQSQFPSPVPPNTIVICEVPITFTALCPLRGTGVVVCLADVTVEEDSYSSFNGLFWVGGDLVLREPSEITGVTIVGGSVDISGSADTASLTYDDGILDQLRQEITSYRLSSSFAYPRRQRF
jgi:hypothetical protein